jgi:hypothetical protein
MVANGISLEEIHVLSLHEKAARAEGLGEGVRQPTESEERIRHLGEDVEGQHRMVEAVGLAQLI